MHSSFSHSSQQQSCTAVTNIQQISSHSTQKQPSKPLNYNIQFKAEKANSTQSFSAIQTSL
jgi:hypothetical protein